MTTPLTLETARSSLQTAIETSLSNSAELDAMAHQVAEFYARSFPESELSDRYQLAVFLRNESRDRVAELSAEVERLRRAQIAGAELQLMEVGL